MHTGERMDTSFFEEQLMQSQVKTAIVSRYFVQWASVIANTQKVQGGDRIAYIDLFSGPGRYKDGTVSTPIMILDTAIKSDLFRDRLVTVFNDRDKNNTDSLQTEIKALPGIDSLKHQPQIFTMEVGEEIENSFRKMKLIPTLLFVDPWGYKGLSLKLINSVLKDWGCESIFFFNYNRISMGINNDFVKPHMVSLFGEDRTESLRSDLEQISDPREKEYLIIEELCNALKDMGGKFVLPFRFKAKGGIRTSHHLIFVTKHFKGYDLMKEVMAKEASENDEGVSSFEYNPVKHNKPRQQLLFKLSRPIEELIASLLSDFKGKTLTVEQLYREHSVDTQYIFANYKKALLQLEEEGRIAVTSEKKRRPKNTLAKHLTVSFS